VVARQSWWVPEDRLVHIPNGVPAADPPRRAAGGGPVLIGTVAPLRPEKRLDWLLRALAGMGDGPAWRLLVAGDGPERGRLEAEAARLGLADRVAFLGHQREPRRTLGGVDLYALSSATEQLPMSLLDAMALGLPVAGVRVGDVAEAVAAPNRPYIAPPDDLAALARALRALLGDAALRARLGAANRERQRERYGEERMRDAYAGLIESALRGAAGPQPGACLTVA
jgi:glycosyltransferase involved in cell wall biosynthesis